MEPKDYAIVFEMLLEAQEEQSSVREIIEASDEIAALRKIVLEVSQPEYRSITTT